MKRSRSIGITVTIFDRDEADHFKIVRAAKTFVMKLFPIEHISDFHLDSYVILFYKDGIELPIRTWLGVDKKDFPEDEMIPISKIKDLMEEEYLWPSSE